MPEDQQEDNQLRSVALQNAKSILAARERAERELTDANAALEVKTGELAASLAMVQATLESTTDAILVTDSQGKVTNCNRKYAEMWGITPKVMEANIITPLVQRKAISLPPPPAFVLGSELLMGLLLGGAGLAFATPLAAVVLVLVNMLYIQDVFGERGSLPSHARRDKR